MPNTHNISDKSVEVSRNILAFKPRQVLLLQQAPPPSPLCPKPTRTVNLMAKQGGNENPSLSPSQRDALVRSVARFLQRSGFSKTLKKLRSEAKFKEDNAEDSLFDLEVMLLKYLEICGDGSNDAGSNKGSVSTGAKQEEKKSDSLVQAVASEASPKKVDKKKEKKPKKEKNEVVSGEQVDDQKQDGEMKLKKGVDSSVQESLGNGDSEMQDKKKEKKQKKEKKKLVSDKQVDDQKQDGAMKSKKEEDNSIPESLSNGNGKPNQVEENVIIKQDATSKKRKRHASDKDEDVQASEIKTIEESKRRKTGAPEEAKLSEEAMKTPFLGKSEGDETVHVDSNPTNNGTSKQIDGHANGHLKENGEKSVDVNSVKKPRKGSVEPTSVKRFQRVNADEIVISNEKLQDNSYWAKDGAESGYGAKAEQILSQVRGRGFRHEKTKKKRGTYRGGQIDVHSHSVKFNYSDEE